MDNVWQKIPQELTDLILQFDGSIRKRRGKYINQIPPYDARYNMIQSIPRQKISTYVFFHTIIEMQYEVQFTNYAYTQMSITKYILGSSEHQYKKPHCFNDGESQIFDYQGIRYIFRNKRRRCYEF
jgi:hypothetical protein